MPDRDLPIRPDLEQLRHQAKDLLHGLRTGDMIALADFQQYHPELTDVADAKLADAQLVLARSYGATSAEIRRVALADTPRSSRLSCRSRTSG